jgi:hypothetical protein
MTETSDEGMKDIDEARMRGDETMRDEMFVIWALPLIRHSSLVFRHF